MQCSAIFGHLDVLVISLDLDTGLYLIIEFLVTQEILKEKNIDNKHMPHSPENGYFRAKSLAQNMHTLMLIYHSHKPVLLHKCCQACPPSILYVFFTRINPWKLGETKFKIDKVIQRLLKLTNPIEYKKYMVSTNLE